ncbi:DUF3558 domain-containing protein [Nocardia sp. CNY236]|uniref:DUF3558 domain-containing protein n=1 Tax=Nocardia sp. CNY236 TaxID=1169152 RepID=UPI0004214312|nr:DUF3558 domain-containing protein [Nocardia sp. CNY236]
MRGIRLVAAAVLVLGLAACGEATSTDKSAATTTKVVLYDPCTIPDEAVLAAGVDPKTKESGIEGRPRSGWEICGWYNDDFALTVYSSARTIRDYGAKARNADFQSVTIAGRPGEQFRVDADNRDFKCDVVFAAEQGSVQISLLSLSPRATDLPDPCRSLSEAASSLVPHLPR